MTPRVPSTSSSNGKHVTGLIGGGGHRADRALARPRRCAVRLGRQDRPVEGQVWPFADILAVRGGHNPDGGEIDSTPTASRCATAATSSRTPVATTARRQSQEGDLDARRLPRHAWSPLRRSSSLPARHHDPDAGRPHDRRRAPEGSERLRRPADGLPVPARRSERVGHRTRRLEAVYASGFTNIIDIAWGPRARSTCSRSGQRHPLG